MRPYALGMIDRNEVAAVARAIAGERVSVRVEGARAGVVLDATGLTGRERDAMEALLKQTIAQVPGVEEARVVVTAERLNRTIVAVASGKGGVGKSTLSANLAVAMARGGRRTGLVDADIHGPSQPRLMAAERRPTARDQVIDPVPTKWGVPMLSMGQLIEPGKAIAWRGPMAAGALGQLFDADWGATDTLVVDLPPGTGDIQITTIKQYKPAGAVIVSTPQDLALIDATRAIDLFRQSGVPIIGLVENMAGYACPHCGEVSDPFGRGGAEAAAAAMDIPFLGRVPLDIAIRTASDAGEPPAARDDDQVFAPIAARVAAWLDAR